MHTKLKRLRSQLDRYIVGHDGVKDALLLGMVCREHIYLEGPPGCAKTMMAELAARGSDLRFFFHHFHRDTRLSELVGDVVLERRELPDGSGERISQQIEPGGILTAEVCVLDDLSRAPGEALNVLLRILNERRFGSEPIPLLTAIATGNPLRDDYYNEPLDPANLDRFAIQMRMAGLLQSGDDGAARQLVDRFADSPELAEPVSEAVTDRASFDQLYSELLEVEIPIPVREGLLEILRVLIEEHGVSEENGLLTDRSFLVKALKLIRGRALLSERVVASAEDLEVLEAMTTFRVPREVHEQVPLLIRRVAG